jgi:hypothetical protein
LVASASPPALFSSNKASFVLIAKPDQPPSLCASARARSRILSVIHAAPAFLPPERGLFSPAAFNRA